MSKREHGNMNGSSANEGSRRSKRRKEVDESSSDVDVTRSDPMEPIRIGRDDSSAKRVRDQGMLLWTTVRDAVNKDGISLSAPFAHKVPKKLYPDYYDLIKQPIALDDIKKKLDHNGYTSLLAVRDDFELLFANARQYNQTESVIYQDAVFLWKLVQKTYSKIVPNDDEDDKKGPSLSRLIRTRLEKLMEKKDASGRIICTEFKELPSKKEWPIYYKQIKRPQCLENIAKRIRHKEYLTSAQFAEDVELVFDNALTFNQENTPIWNDAATLRDYFRQLMSDMPPPHALPEHSKSAITKPSNKIKIKPPQPIQTTGNSAQPTQKQDQALFLRVPASHPNTSAKPASQAPANASSEIPPQPAVKVSATAETPSSAPKNPKPQSKPPPPPQPQVQITKTPTPQPVAQTVSFINATPSHYPRTAYTAPAPQILAPNPVMPSAIPPTFNTNSTLSTSQSPAPVVLPLNHQLKSISLRIQPKGRTLTLDHRDGVKSWAIRLVPGESTIVVSNVTFLGDHEDEGSSGDDEDEKDDDYDMDVDVESGSASPSKNGKKKGKGRGRGRPPKSASTKVASSKAPKSPRKKPSSKVGEIQLKLNNFVVKEQPDAEGEWNLYLPVGSSTIEVGEVGGMLWKVYTERLADA